MGKLSILNWQSRRATEPVAAAIAAFADGHKGVVVEQTIRPLSDFEHQGIEDVARRHDIIVFDHPFCGAIAASACFVPLDEVMADIVSPEMADRYIGPSLATYRFAGHVWGAPIDGATQNAIYRADLLGRLGAALPRSHGDVLALGEAARSAGLYLGTAIETPHALMSVMSHMANLGQPMTADEQRMTAIPAESFVLAYDAVRTVLDMAPPEAMGWNSIDLHEAMVRRNDIVYAPLVYGYATYGEPDFAGRLSFAPYAGLTAPYCAGTAIGGTAMGISRFGTNRDEAIAFVRHMASSLVQDRLVAENNGQPGGRGGWEQPDIDARYNGFFSAVTSTMQQAWIRPRYQGYVAFQRYGGEAIAAALRTGKDAGAARAALLELAGLES
jgi:multiple sugar transport system substrate-binding protein